MKLKPVLEHIASMTEEELREVELACAVRRSNLSGKQKDKAEVNARAWYQALTVAAAPHVFPQWIPFRRSTHYPAFAASVPALETLAREFLVPDRRTRATQIEVQSIRLLICEFVTKKATTVFDDAAHHTFIMMLKQAHAVIDGSFPGYRSSDLLPLVAKARFKR